jgi:hypothetical protein
MDEERLLQKIYIWYLLEEGKEGDQKQDGKKAYSERCNNVVYEMETGRTDFFGDWVSKNVAIRHRTTTIQSNKSFENATNLKYFSNNPNGINQNCIYKKNIGSLN